MSDSFTFRGKTFTDIAARFVRWAKGQIDGILKRLTESQLKLAAKAVSKSTTPTPKQIEFANSKIDKAILSRYADALQSSSEAQARAARLAAPSPRGNVPGRAPAAAASPVGTSTGTATDATGTAPGRPATAPTRRAPPTPSRLELVNAAAALITYVQNSLRRNRTNTTKRSEFTQLHSSNRRQNPFIETGEFLDSLTYSIVEGRINIYFPARRHKQSDITYRDLYTILSLGARIPITERSKAYFQGKFHFTPQQAFYTIPARPFLKQLVMQWCLRNRKYLPYVMLPPF